MIYLDYHATTPCDPRVVDVMMPYFSEIFGNPASSTHRLGQLATDAVEKSREQVAHLINSRSREILFTGGATESNNLVIQGLAQGSRGKRRRIVTTIIEHKSVLAPCKELQNQGFDVVILPVNQEGIVDLHAAEEAINEDTLLVSIQAANNEIGTIQPVAELAVLAHERGALIHCDAAQAVGKIPVNVESWDVDFLSLSGHKLYGPKGIGVLYIRGGPFALPIKPLLLGGGQENSLRSGTLNVPGIVGLGEACKICEEILTEEALRTTFLRDKLEQKILHEVQGSKCNGAIQKRLPGNSSVTFPGIDAEALIVNVPELAISAGSACTSGAPEPSHVLQAIGLSRGEAYNTVRIGLGRFTTEEEVAEATRLIVMAVKRLRAIQAESSA